MADIEKNVEDAGTDLISFGIIADAGDAKSLAYMALAAAKKGSFDEAEDLMKQSSEAFLRAHHKQTELLVKEANGEHTPVNVMLVHAQDHLMNASQARDFVTEIIELYRVVLGSQE